MGFQSTTSVLFNGTSQYGTAGNVLAFEYTQPFSLSFWYKTTAGGFFVAKSATTGPSRGYGVGVHTGGTIKFEMTNTWSSNVNFVYTTATGLNDGNWHHCVATWDGNAIGGAGGMHIYIDASDAPLTTVYSSLSATIVTTNSFWVGGRDASDHQYYNGALDEVAVHNKELTADEILWMFNAGWGNDLNSVRAPSNLVSWWRMGEHTAGGVVPDWATGGSYDLTLVNSPTMQSDGPVPASAYSANYVDSSALTPEIFTPEQHYVSSYVESTGISYVYTPVNTYASSGLTVYFKMRARDSGVPAPGYVTWVVQNDPDFGGTYYPDGEPTPVGSMVPGSAVVVSQWQELPE